MARITATEAARNFSEILNRVTQGEDFEITRNGATVAHLSPVKARLVSPERLRELLETLPVVDEDFEEDLREIREESGSPRDPWQS